MIVSGSVTEFYFYERPQWKGIEKTEAQIERAKLSRQRTELRRKYHQELMEKATGTLSKDEMKVLVNSISEEISRREDNIASTKKKVRRVINSNPQLNKFLTLTFEENQGNLDEANKAFKNFIDRMKYHYKKIEYVCVVEFQKRGAVHYHLLCNLKYVKKEELTKVWSHGNVKIKRIDRVDNLGAYVTKYMQKDHADPRLVGRKAFFKSQGLKQPVEVIDPKKIESALGKLTPFKTFELEFESEYTGKSKYVQCNTKRNVAPKKPKS